MQPFSSNPSEAKLPGRLYTFIVLSLATIVIGISIESLRSSSIGSEEHADSSASLPADSALTRTLPVDQDSTASVDGGEPNTAPTVSSRRLIPILAIAVLIGGASMIPSRKSASERLEQRLDTAMISEAAGLPLLGNVLPGKPTAKRHGPKTRSANRWLATLLFGGEIILCIAVIVAIYGCLTQSDISSAFLHNPLDAFVQSVRHVAQSVAGLFGHEAYLA